MESDNPKPYWRSVAERDGHREEPPPWGVSRRAFLQAAGFTVTLAATEGCHRAPVDHALPRVTQAEGAIPGRAQQFATTCGGCPAGCGLLATVRDGRPLKMEGMPEHPLSRGGLCAVGQALPMGLYDRHRLHAPRKQGREVTWAAADDAIQSALAAAEKNGGKVRVVTPTLSSPTLQQTIGDFLKRFADGRQVVIDPISVSAIAEAHARTHGRRVLPRYQFDQAQVIVSFDADFLGAWIAPVEHTVGWQAGRTLPAVASPTSTHDPMAGAASSEANGHAGAPSPAHSDAAASATKSPTADAQMSYHVQFESRMTITGSNADKRWCVHPSALGALASYLLQRIQGETPTSPAPIDASALDALARQLSDHRGASLVVCGSQDVAVQILVNRLNEALQNYGRTLDIERFSRQRLGNDRDLDLLVSELKQGAIGALIVLDVDLTYQLPPDVAIDQAIRQVPLTIAMTERMHDFAERAHFVCPGQHALESWLDAEPVSGLLSIQQPTMLPRTGTRSVLESFAAWSGKPQAADERIRQYWQQEVFPRQQTTQDFPTFWNRVVHDGFVLVPPSPTPSSEASSEALLSSAAGPALPEVHQQLTLILHATTAIPDSRHAHNPWLQELPDPITKVTWDNYATISPEFARSKGLAEHDIVRLTIGDRSLEVPVFIQPGQHDRVVAVALHYGVPGTERFAKIGPNWLQARPTVGRNGLVGVNGAVLTAFEDGGWQYARSGLEITKTTRRHVLATTQLHDTIEVPAATKPPGSTGRHALVQEARFSDYQRDPAAGAPHAHPSEGPLWYNDHLYTSHRWGMVIDLNRCTGCSACLIACQSENNIPVVGRDEVHRHREMHWIRIDRYYSGDEADPQVVHQPMMCQHCANAPCETVCPVLATVHSSEGLNQQVYNRCVGTRYCANNCPYKVRRFNWFDYAHDDTLQNLALNPEVTVRMRGIMEKCSMCVQRIQEAKIEARSHPPAAKDVGPPDGAIRTACQQSCPAQAIVFGDLNDPHSRVSQAMADARRFTVLEELNVQPSVGYLRKIRNQS